MKGISDLSLLTWSTKPFNADIFHLEALLAEGSMPCTLKTIIFDMFTSTDFFGGLPAVTEAGSVALVPVVDLVNDLDSFAQELEEQCCKTMFEELKFGL